MATFEQLSSREIIESIDTLRGNGRVKVVTPTIFQSADGKILLVGRHGDLQKKLPDHQQHLTRRNNPNRMQPEALISHLAVFIMERAEQLSVAENTDFVGIAKIKPDDPKIVAPIHVSLPVPSNHPDLARTADWANKVTLWCDHFWLPMDEVTDMAYEAGLPNSELNPNTAIILNARLATLEA